MTSLLCVYRGSSSAAYTTRTSDASIVRVQKEWLRSVSATSIPTRDLNHCRRSSTMEIAAIGTLNNATANLVSPSNAPLAFVSSRPEDRTKKSLPLTCQRMVERRKQTKIGAPHGSLLPIKIAICSKD